MQGSVHGAGEERLVIFDGPQFTLLGAVLPASLRGNI